MLNIKVLLAVILLYFASLCRGGDAVDEERLAPRALDRTSDWIEARFLRPPER